MKKGTFIVIEGIRGSGKSTVIKHLQSEFSNNSNVLFTREPGGSHLAEKIREIMLSEDARQADGNTQFSLVWASRADHLKNTIIPALNKGINIITDRFDASTYGIQLYAQEAQYLKELFFKLREIYLKEYVPDLYVFLDVDPEEGRKRVGQRNNNNTHFHDREAEYYERMHEGYFDFLNHVPHVIIDANRDVEKVKEECVKVVRDIFNS